MSNLPGRVRVQAKAERDRKITELAAEGKTQREIAAEVGVSQPLVAKVTTDHKQTMSECNQTTPRADLEPQLTPETEPEPAMKKTARVATDPDKSPEHH